MRRFGAVFLAVATLGAGTVLAQSAPATPGFYSRFDTGPSFSDDAGGSIGGDLGNGGIGSIGLGYRFTPRFRTDVTLGYRGGYQLGGGNVNDTDVSALTGMFNGYVDLGTWGRFTPYLGAGLGFSRNEIDDIRGTIGGASFRIPGDDRVSFAWQAGFGTGIQLTDNAVLDLGYRYQDMGLVRSSPALSIGGVPVQADAVDGHLRGHELQLGLRVNF